MVAAPQALDHRLFDDALARGHAGQRAGKAAALYRKGGVRGHQLLPRDCGYAVKQLIERGDGESFQEDQHTLSTAAPQVGGGDDLRSAAEGDAPVRDGDVPRAGALKVKGCGAFHAEITGCDQIIFQHGGSFRPEIAVVNFP